MWFKLGVFTKEYVMFWVRNFCQRCILVKLKVVFLHNS